MVKQRTLKHSFSLEGKGVHSGINGKIVFNPAPDNYGYKIRRIDMLNKPIINAVVENAFPEERGVRLSQNGVSVSSVTHALAALYACEIDNCLIDINVSEFPSFDGSSFSFVRKIKEVGVTFQESDRLYISFPRKKIKVHDESGRASILLLPSDHLQVESHISFDSMLLRRQSAYLQDLTDFTKEIAPSRTFVFVKDLEALLRNNLIRGGSVDNAIIIYDKFMSQEDLDSLADRVGVKRKNANKLGYMMSKPLLFVNEPARHKLLDIIGDLALIGYFIKGEIIAHCPGHALNHKFARTIRELLNERVDNKMNNIILI